MRVREHAVAAFLLAAAALSPGPAAALPPPPVDGEVSGDCQLVRFTDTEKDVKALGIVLHGEAVTFPAPVSITAGCEVSGPAGRVAWVEASAPGPVVATADVALLPLAAYEVCWYVHATWSGSEDGHYERCTTV